MGLFEPEVEAAENHEDQAGGDEIHGVGPDGCEAGVAAVAGIVGNVAGEGVEDFGDAPGVDGGVADIGAALGEVGFDEVKVAGGADLEFEGGTAGVGGGPEDFAIDGHLAHEIAGLLEIAGEVSGRRDDGELEFGFAAVLPGFVKGPGGVVQEEAGEGEEPDENEEEKTGVKVEFAIPALAKGEERGGSWRSGRGWREVVSGRRHRPIQKK